MNFARVSWPVRRAGNQRTHLSPHWLAVYNSAGERPCAIRGRFTVRVLFDKLFRDRDALIAGRLGRWLIVIVALALGAFLVIAPTSSAQEGSLNQLAGVGLLALGALTFLYALLCEFLIAREGRIAPEEWDRQEQERRVREGVEQAAKMQAIYGALNAGGSLDRSWSQ